jgi:hypothetical protein
MQTERIGTLHLAGDDAVSFAHSFFFPSSETIKEQKERRAKRDGKIHLKESGDGFSAEVDDLDLTCLEEPTGQR